jgi:hypothetical protein
MAPVSDDGAAPRRLRAAQRGLTQLLLRDMRKLRRLIVSSRLEESLPDWMVAVEALVNEYGRTSATVAADFYEARRADAAVPGEFGARTPDPPPPEQVKASLRWATKDVWARDEAVATQVQLRPLGDRLAVAEVKAEQVTQRLVADQGRETIRQAVREDRQAVGFARAAALGACAFCRLMASRGMVYKTAGAAGRDANELFSGDASVAKYHNDCHCAIIPVFRGQQFELSAHAREWDRLYREYAAPFPGDQLRRFRRAIAEHG